MSKATSRSKPRTRPSQKQPPQPTSQALIDVIDELHIAANVLKNLTDIQRLEAFAKGDEHPLTSTKSGQSSPPAEIVGTTDAIVAAVAWRLECAAHALEQAMQRSQRSQ